ASLAAEVSVPEGRELVREGDYSYDVLAIEEGTASGERDGARIADLGPGDVVGEMGVLERSQRNATVRATSPRRLVTLTGWDSRRLRRAAARRRLDRRGHRPSAQERPERGRAPARRRLAAPRARVVPEHA